MEGKLEERMKLAKAVSQLGKLPQSSASLGGASASYEEDLHFRGCISGVSLRLVAANNGRLQL